ncbi:MAG: hypothetical protein ACYDCQ_06840 [Dehalococcoidia bacterium]
MSTTWIRVCYGILLGVVLTASAGFGVLTFETGPKAPQPVGVSFVSLTGTTTDQETARIGKQIDSFFSDNQTYRDKYPDHQRNIFLWFAGLGLLFGAIGVALPTIVNYLRFGFMVGGLFLVAGGVWFALQPVPQGAPPAASILSLLSAGTPNGLDSAGRFLRFAVVIVGLLVLLFVGLWRLTDWSATGAVEPRLMPVLVPVVPAVGVAPVPAPPTTYATPAGTIYAPAAQPPGDTLKWAPPNEQPVETTPPVPPAVESETVFGGERPGS